MHRCDYELITFTLTTGHKTKQNKKKKQFLFPPKLLVMTSCHYLLLLTYQLSGCTLHHLRNIDGPLEPTEPP